MVANFLSYTKKEVLNHCNLDNIYRVAEEFIDKNALSLEHANQIVEFLMKNVKTENAPIEFSVDSTVNIAGVVKKIDEFNSEEDFVYLHFNSRN